jgi:hypothetical protein
MAPEVALAKPYSHKAEVFAFATVLWEMASHERPFADCDVDSFYRCAAAPRLPPRLLPYPTRVSRAHASHLPMISPVPLFSGAFVQRASGHQSHRASRRSSLRCSPAAGAPITPPVPRWPRSSSSCVS